MPINIKELHKSDLDPNDNSWWSKDKIDKINYNFNQLTSGGMIGPIGPQGVNGLSGAKGPIGDVGAQGIIGPTGLQGPDGNSDWYGTDGTISTVHIYPSKPLVEYTPPAFGIGYENTQQQPFGYYDDFFNIKTDTTERVQLSLTSGDIKSEHRFFIDDTTPVYEYGFVRNGSPTFSNRILLRPNDTYSAYAPTGSTWNSTLEIKGTGVKSAPNTLFTARKSVTVNGNTRIQKDAEVGYIMTSTDNQGKVTWSDPNSVLPSYKYGMIISIPSYLFNSTNFNLDTTYTQTFTLSASSTPPEPIRFKFGRGIEGTSYEGWYLCNGQKWNSLPGVNETQVPNLNQVNLTIEPSGDQPNINSFSNDVIVGGHPISIRAVSTGNKYDIVYNSPFYDDDNISDSIKIPLESPSKRKTFDLTQMVHLIKLDRNDLEWEVSSSVANPISTISLVGPKSNARVACLSNDASNYSWDAPAGTDWVTFDDSTTDYKLYLNGTYNYAPTGYYRNGTTTRYWSQSAGILTNAQSCGPTVQLSLEVGTTVFEVNYNRLFPTINLLTTNNSDLANSTFLWNSSTNSYAAAGWYSTQAQNAGRVRRYWDGSQFVGDSIYGMLMMTIEVMGGTVPIRLSKSTSSHGACNDFNTAPEHELFIMNNNASLLVGFTGVLGYATFPWNGYKIYANKNWSTTSTPGSIPLVEIKNQTFPGSTNPTDKVTYLVDGHYDNGILVSDTNLSITSDSKPNVGGYC